MHLGKSGGLLYVTKPLFSIHSTVHQIAPLVSFLFPPSVPVFRLVSVFCRAAYLAHAYSPFTFVHFPYI